MKAGIVIGILLSGLFGAACTDIPSIRIPETRQEARSLYATNAAALPPRPETDPARAEWETARLHLRKANFLLSADSLGSNELAYVARDLDEVRRASAAIRAEKPPKVIKGYREEGYHSPNDDSFQPFLRYLPASWRPGRSLPLLVYLHGYSPELNLLNWQGIPPDLTALAESGGYLVAAPFGRGNTDYQGIGEQDVLAVIREMIRRYGADPRRIILFGISMGGTGAWCLAARHPDLFAGAFILSGRGDYYAWHGVTPGEVPAWKRVWIDDVFAGPRAESLKDLPVFCAHGALDFTVPVHEARAITAAVGAVSTNLIYLEFPDSGHELWMDDEWGPRLHRWLAGLRRPEPGFSSGLEGKGPGIWGAFLGPFVFVLADERDPPPERDRFRQAVGDWYRYGKAMPRTAWEKTIASNILTSCHVFLYGEPETSGLIRQVLARSPVRVTADSFIIGGEAYPRSGSGLYLMQPSPWNPAKKAVIQCGIPWGEGLPDNHKYDSLPDYIVYTGSLDEDGANTTLCAGYFEGAGRGVE